MLADFSVTVTRICPEHLKENCSTNFLIPFFVSIQGSSFVHFMVARKEGRGSVRGRRERGREKEEHDKMPFKGAPARGLHLLTRLHP